ncbi:MAG: hypothetical protein II886_01335 [Prevotella sp.]|nr:hypothetical protein [Prevotella sp.]
MDKKNYQEPSIRVVKLRHKTLLLAGSTGGTGQNSAPRRFSPVLDDEE